MTDARLRDLAPVELEWVAARERDIFGPAAWPLTLLTEDFAAGGRRYRAIELGGDLAGYAVYGFDGDAFTLMNLAVVEQARGRGLGRAAMDDLLREARRLGVPDVWLEVAVTNAAALSLYRAYGFAEVRIRKGYYQPEGVDAVVMRLAIEPPDARA